MIPKAIRNIAVAQVTSEAEVRTKIVIPLFRELRYKAALRAEEFDIYEYAGHNKVRAKKADIVYFNNNDHGNHRNQESRKWVQKHSLVVVETKKFKDKIVNAEIQAEFYAVWSRAPFYLITNGVEIAIYRVEWRSDDPDEFRFQITELPKYWVQLERLLSYKAVLFYCKTNNLKTDCLRETNYSEYIPAKYLYLQKELVGVLPRTISLHIERPATSLTTDLKTTSGEITFLNPLETLLQSNKSAILLAEPGCGKTYLLKMVALELLKDAMLGKIQRIPVLISAKSWKRDFSNIIKAIRKEIKWYVPIISKSSIEDDFKQKRLLLLVDGLDEITKDPDLFNECLIRVAEDTGTQIIATCRKERNSRQLDTHFKMYTIDQLTNNQIDEYACKMLGVGTGILRMLGPSLSDLVHNPLFLTMVIEVMKHSQYFRLPSNKSNLYDQFIRTLLTYWPEKKGTSQQIRVHPQTKKLILAEYARATYRKGPDISAFKKAIMNHSEIDKPNVIRKELFNSGLLKNESSEPEFYHPSFQEYFFVLDLSAKSGEEILEFTSNHHSDDTHREVFIFLSGLINSDQQIVFFNYLEHHNLKLLHYCLESRFKHDEQTKQEVSLNYIQKYLAQVRSSYLRIIEHHFKELKYLFRPWKTSPECPVETYPDAEIKAVIAEETKAVYYEFSVAPLNSDNTNHITTLTLPHFRDDSAEKQLRSFMNEGCRSLRVDKQGQDINVAREFAFERIKSDLKAILHRKDIYDENLVLGCEYVRTSLKFLSWFHEYKGLSLKLPLEQVIKTLEARSSGIFRSNQTINLKRMISCLSTIRAKGINLADITLPPPDLRWEDVPDENALRALYSDDRLFARISKFYEFFQESYRWMVEKYFPTLKDEFSFYHVGPVKFDVSLYVHDAEDITVYVIWEPVSSEADRTTKVSFVTQYEDERERFRVVDEKLKALGRDWKSMHIGSLHSLERYLSERDILHEEVYKQISKDLERIIGTSHGLI